jgi:vacuolar-type H+-ATPase subunit E/Vma4
MTGDPHIDVALAPVRRALRDAAIRDATDVRRRAQTDADRALAEAASRASTIRSEAREQGAAEAAAVLAVDRVRARHAARAAVLAAHRESYEALRNGARDAVAALRDDADYPRLREGMAAAARRTLGDDTRVRDHPDGGLIGESAGRRIDFSLSGFADRAMDAIIADLDAAWLSGDEEYPP